MGRPTRRGRCHALYLVAFLKSPCMMTRLLSPSELHICQVHTFFLEHLPLGGWRCHWWLKGATSDSAARDRPHSKSVWSAESKIALSRIQGGSLQLPRSRALLPPPPRQVAVWPLEPPQHLRTSGYQALQNPTHSRREHLTILRPGKS